MLRKRRSVRLAVALVVALCLTAGCFFFVAPAVVEMMRNRVAGAEGATPSEAARELHATLRVADLHADSLLWDRDLFVRSSRGHTDVPRLIEGNTALQVFGIVTKAPRGMNIERTDGDKLDMITALAVAQRWSPETWRSLPARALYQANKLRETAARSEGELTLIESASDLAAFLNRRETEPHIVAGLLAVEGAHALEGDLSNVDKLFDAGVRMIAPTHFFDNEVGGSAHGLNKGGLTPLGVEMIRRMEERGITLDLAHASARTFDDALRVATRPVVVSHTGVRGTCPNERNLTDDQLRAVARNGGVIGIGFWETAVCGADAESIARAVRYTADLVGAEHVGLGSDFDGAVTVPFDASRLALVTDALLRAGFTPDEVRLVMGENVLRLLARNLPR